jgi:hypothetical protein
VLVTATAFLGLPLMDRFTGAAANLFKGHAGSSLL